MNEREPTVEYREGTEERVIICRSGEHTVEIAQPLTGYGMLSVRTAAGEIERYYGLDMALDHAAEYLDVGAISVPDEAADMGI